jgi:hypothetical protein
MPSYPPEDTQPAHVTIVYGIVILFAFIGAFYTGWVCQDIIRQMVLAGEQTITTNVTVSSVSCSDNRCSIIRGFIDSGEKGYVINPIFSHSSSHLDTPIVGHTYTIKYFCNIIEGNDRTVMEMIDQATNPYTCITENGVCK